MRRRSFPSRLRFVVLGALVLSGVLADRLITDVGALPHWGDIVLARVGHTNQGLIVSTATRRRVVALSLDDGPDPRFTPHVLGTLRAHHAHATFFAVGVNAQAHPDLIRRELRDGNEVANHTLDHPHLRRRGPLSTRREIDAGRRALIAAGAPDPRLFRAPFGEFTANGISAAAIHGELPVGWSLTVERALDGRSIPAAVAWLMRRVRPGAIILAHDGLLDRARTMQALPLLLDQLRRRGYTVVTVSQLLYASGNLTVRRLLAPAVDAHATPTATATVKALADAA